MADNKEKRVSVSSVSSSILTKKSTPLAALEKRLTTWDLNLADNDWSLMYSIDKDAASVRKDSASTFTDIERKGTGSIFHISIKEDDENSPYDEVRAAVPNYDEDLPVNTIRSWALGLLLSFFGAAVNTIFSLRNPVIGIGVIVAQVLY